MFEGIFNKFGWFKSPPGSYPKNSRKFPTGPVISTMNTPVGSGGARINACRFRDPSQFYYEQTASRTPNSISRDTANCMSCGGATVFNREPRSEQSVSVPMIFGKQVVTSDGFRLDRDQIYTRADICDIAVGEQCNCPVNQYLSPLYPQHPW